MKKKILDVCCESRMFWFDKENENTIYMDKRQLEDTLCDGRKLLINPDVILGIKSPLFSLLVTVAVNELRLLSATLVSLCLLVLKQMKTECGLPV
ncbi:hypothetical protein [Thomasclavelia ramosa]|uniref:hypothetical protein n=1 Tax=Thomasclavelia ramosa TaxID=1547 RepID=UPI001F3059C3|nr:hypothetical protein [Thomasclavelia ramosa]